MAHAAVSYREQHWFGERLARGDLGQAGATAEPFQVWLDHWQLSTGESPNQWQVQVSHGQPDKENYWAFDLELTVRGRRWPTGLTGLVPSRPAVKGPCISAWWTSR